MGKRIEVLDHGYVELIESYGSDQRIIEAARMSTDKGFKGWGPVRKYRCRKCKKIVPLEDTYLPEAPSDPGRCHTGCWRACDVETKPGDEKLLAYLWKNKHATPFEMGGLVIEVKAPIFIYRQWHRHRTQSYNEMSARYTALPDENYVPTVERLMADAGKNKQAGSKKGSKQLVVSRANSYRYALKKVYDEQQRFYEEALRVGVPKELARVHLPVARYSKMRASANLRNWLAFLTLRMDSHAQWEIQEYARAVGKFIEHIFPYTWALFMEGREA